jgi:hypothetical protein
MIIPIDNFRRKAPNNDAEPALLLNKKGAIMLNSAAQTFCKLHESNLYIHFYDDGGKLYFKMDKESVHGVKVRYLADKKLCIAQASNVVTYLAEKYEVVVQEKGSVALGVKEADFGKYEAVIPAKTEG